MTHNDDQQKLADMAIWACFWSLVAFKVLAFLFGWFIHLQMQIMPEMAGQIWAFALSQDHPAAYVFPGIIELLIGWLCFCQFRHEKLDHLVLVPGKVTVPGISFSVIGTYFYQTLTFMLVIWAASLFGEAQLAIWREGFQTDRLQSQMMGFILVGVIIAPVIEEFLFRGVLFSTLKARGWPLPVIIMATSVGFALLHNQYTPLGLVLISLIGVYLCCLRIWSGGLILPMIAHLTINARALMSFFEN